ncbi:MAG: sugar phosphate nucleotidyltransferase [Candidatus Peribacteraceae bacterium]|nr:sugar phosphate nucleotidyltransferase [Candidatus Peribacteraceae bacterium]MDD5074566.1 sugar phosphate nucleotidyltransferase [Candidatus Peribacteraceae bacterium]
MKITQAILPVAGLGTRFLPWTKVVPKELLPMGNRPIISYIVDECLEAGIKDICFVINHGKESIPAYFRENARLNEELRERGKLSLLNSLKKYRKANFHVVYQEEMLGDGHALLQAKSWVNSPMIAVLFGDDLFVGADSGIRQLINAAGKVPKKESAFIATENIPREMTRRYGIIDPADNINKNIRRVQGLVEKPDPSKAPSTLGIVGRYLIPRSTFDVLPRVQMGKDGEIRLIDALIAQLKKLPIYAVECEGKRIDTGTPEGYLKAVEMLGILDGE